jgi:hypothetical protein
MRGSTPPEEPLELDVRELDDDGEEDEREEFELPPSR